MPCDDAFGLPGCDSLEHVVKHGPARRLRAEGFLEDANDLDILPANAQSLHLLALRIDGQYLAVFVLTRLSAVEEILHRLMVDWISASSLIRGDDRDSKASARIAWRPPLKGSRGTLPTTF